MEMTLRGAILQKYPSASAFGKSMGWGRQKASDIMNGRRQPTADEMVLMLAVSIRYPDIVMHIHDEMVVEVPEDAAELALGEISTIMGMPIPWAPGLLLRADSYTTKFYKKD